MRPIPQSLREDLDADPDMHVCAVRYRGIDECSGRIQWHHVWIYAGKQINESWAILGACEHHHDLVQSNRDVRKEFERISLSKATATDLAKYPRKKWGQIRNWLNENSP